MIEFDQVTKIFAESGTVSLDGVTMTVPEHSIVGLIGSNGAGKSTLLRTAAGVYRQDGGLVLIDGEPVYDNISAKSKLAYISDDQYYLPGTTMRGMAKVHASLRGGFNMDKFSALAGKFGLDPDKRLSGFSKGMRRQSDICTALSCGAKYVLCDETFDGLDPVTRNLAKKIFIEEVAEGGAAILMSSHNLRELEDLCDRIVLIQKGKLVVSADLEDLRGTVSKYRAVFKDVSEEVSFGELDPLFMEKSGKMLSFIAEGDEEKVRSVLSRAAAEKGGELAYFEALSLSLEEIFSCKLKESGFIDDEGRLV